MSNITLEGIAELLKTELDPISADIGQIKQTLEEHTTALANLATDVKTLLDEKTISAARFDRLEHWGQKVGEKVGIKLEL